MWLLLLLALHSLISCYLLWFHRLLLLSRLFIVSFPLLIMIPSHKLLIAVPLFSLSSTGSCYFPIEYQGTFMMQNTISVNTSSGASTVSYSEITVEADSIPPWGRCYRRRGNTVFLVDSSGPEDCIRCLHLTLKTLNVIQIHAEGKCASCVHVCYFGWEKFDRLLLFWLPFSFFFIHLFPLFPLCSSFSPQDLDSHTLESEREKRPSEIPVLFICLPVDFLSVVKFTTTTRLLSTSSCTSLSLIHRPSCLSLCVFLHEYCLYYCSTLCVNRTSVSRPSCSQCLCLSFYDSQSSLLLSFSTSSSHFVYSFPCWESLVCTSSSLSFFRSSLVFFSLFLRTRSLIHSLEHMHTHIQDWHVVTRRKQQLAQSVPVRRMLRTELIRRLCCSGNTYREVCSHWNTGSVLLMDDTDSVTSVWTNRLAVIQQWMNCQTVHMVMHWESNFVSVLFPTLISTSCVWVTGKVLPHSMVNVMSPSWTWETVQTMFPSIDVDCIVKRSLPDAFMSHSPLTQRASHNSSQQQMALNPWFWHPSQHRMLCWQMLNQNADSRTGLRQSGSQLRSMDLSSSSKMKVTTITP